MDKKLLRFYPSPINRRLKIFWKEGKKILNTKNANYSYDGLQEALNKGLVRMTMEEINSALVLEMGGGCVVDSLRNKYFYHGPMVGVEADPMIVDFAEKEFDIAQYDDAKIIQADA